MLTAEQNAAFWVANGLLSGGRIVFFETSDASLPVAKSEEIRSDDLVPQFGFVGARYRAGGLLILGINPGNGGRGVRTASDARMMPVLHAFRDKAGPALYRAAMKAQMEAFSGWNASREIGPAITAAGVELEELAYINANPYRAGTGGARDVFPNLSRMRLAAEAFVRPMIQALSPGVVIAHGVTAAKVLHLAAADIKPIVYDRERIKASRDRKNAGFASELIARLRGKCGDG